MAHLSPLLKQATPVVAARGEGALLFDEQDRRYLDFTAGIGVTSTGHAHPDDVCVTPGSHTAVDLATHIFIDPGDVIVAEAPSYVGALSVFRAYQADVVHVTLDGEGLVPEELDATLTRLATEGRRVKFLYTVPNFHNPAGVTMSLERRPRIVEICKRHHVLILEDNPYGLLGFDGDPEPALKSFDEDAVIYLGSFSKTFAPGYRVGWALCPHAVRE